MYKKAVKRVIAAVCACTMVLSTFTVTALAENALNYQSNGKSVDFVGASLEFSKSTITLKEADEPQFITLTVKSPNRTLFESTGLHIVFDEDMEILPIEDDYPREHAECLRGGCIDVLDSLWHSVFIATASASSFVAKEEGTPFVRFRVKLKDPQPGKRYNVTIAYRNGDLFTCAFSKDGDKIQDYAFTHVEPGYIEISDIPEESSCEEDSEPDSSSIENSDVSSSTSDISEESSTISEISDDSSGTVEKTDESSSDVEISDDTSSDVDKHDSSIADEEIGSTVESSDSECVTFEDSDIISSAEESDDNSKDILADSDSSKTEESSVPDESSMTESPQADNSSKAEDKNAEPKPPVTVKPREIKPKIMGGDTNGDGVIDIEDAVAGINFINGEVMLTKEQIKAADVDANGGVDVEDVAAIINHINGVKLLG